LSRRLKAVSDGDVMTSDTNAMLPVVWQVDIDNILLMAETRSSDDMKNSATDELLSQFKVPQPHATHFYCSVETVTVPRDL